MQTTSEAHFRPEKVTDRILHRIETMIDSGRLKPGDKLPSERELASRLKVNRATVREAIYLLIERGRLARTGRTTRVVEVQADMVGAVIERYFVSNNCTYQELNDVRAVLEPSIAAWAALNRDKADMERLRILIEELEESWAVRDLKTAALRDVEFHLALADATHNILILAIVHGFARLMGMFMRLSYASVPLREESFRQHRVIYDAVSAGDALKAQEAMRQHIATSPPLLNAR